MRRASEMSGEVWYKWAFSSEKKIVIGYYVGVRPAYPNASNLI